MQIAIQETKKHNELYREQVFQQEEIQKLQELHVSS